MKTKKPSAEQRLSKKRTDAELMGAAQGGSDAAFHELLDRHAQKLFGLAYSLTGNRADAEDIVQETFTGAFRGLSRFEGRASVSTWLTRILVRQVARHRRNRGRKCLVRLEEPGTDTPRDSEPTTAPDTERTELRMDVNALMARLAPDHREVLLLREMQGLSYGEIADVLDLPKGTVESRLYRARQEMKVLLKDYAP